MIKTDKRKAPDILASPTVYAMSATLIGAVLFLLIYGFATLLPTNVSFIYNSKDADVFNHQLGFDFFRTSPWRNPIGLQSYYPYPYESSVIYSDSIPLLAFFFKLLSPILPEYFQYFGIWIFLCFILQGVSSSLVLKKIGLSYMQAMLCVPFFILNVPFLFRCFHHSALAGQWLILFSFLMILSESDMKPRKRIVLWTLLCGGSVLIHGYLFFMTGFLMSFSCFYRFFKEKKRVSTLAVFFSCVIASLFAYYLGGGMLPHANIIMGGFPHYLFDPVDLINPLIYSSFLPPIVYLCSKESAVYWGLAFIILLLMSVIFIIIKRRSIKPFFKKHRFIIILTMIASLFLFVISEGPRPRIAGQTLFNLIKPDSDYDLIAFLSTFRATARFILPVLYLIQICVFYVISRFVNKQTLFTLILIPCIILQYAEIVPKTAKGGADSIVSGYHTVFNDCFDNTFSSNARHLSFISDNYENIAAAGVFASHHNMTLNTSKACRGPKNSVWADITAWNAEQLSQDTVYLIPDDYIPYLKPVLLTDDHLIYYCDEMICIFHKDLLQNTPGEDAAMLDSSMLYDILDHYYDPELAATPIGTFDDR